MTSPPLGNSSPILSHFCVYNTSLGSSAENSKDHILYYTAKTAVPLDVKMRHVGLAQALVNFSATFPGANTENVHSQKHRMVFLQPEPGFWMYICIELGTLRRQTKDAKGKEKLVTEYLDTQLNNKALEAVLQIGYEQFQLLYGTFSSVLISNQRRPRALAHAIEEFFSEWIWRWDFDRLDIMCFQAVFNGVPMHSISRQHYLETYELDRHLQSKLNVEHTFILNAEDGSVIYRSPALTTHHIRSLRKLSLRRIEKQIQTEKKVEVKKETGLKAFTKTLSNNQFVSYFSSGGSKSTDLQQTQTSSIPTDKEIEGSQGVFLTGLIESTAIGMNGEERQVTKADLVRVYLGESLNEYYLIIYKKNDLVWHFLLPATEDSEDAITNVDFYTELQTYIAEKNCEALSDILKKDILTMKEKRNSFDLGKHYTYFFYDNMTLNIKSTLADFKTPFAFQREALFRLLEIRDDLGNSPSQVFTRSTSNCWIAGQRVYANKPNGEDYTEMYLVASKKNVSLAEVEETLNKMMDNLANIMHFE